MRSTPCQLPCHALGTMSYNKARPLSSRRLRPRCLLTRFQNITEILTCSGARASVPVSSAETRESNQQPGRSPEPQCWSSSSWIPLHMHPRTPSLSTPSSSGLHGLWATHPDLRPLGVWVCMRVCVCVRVYVHTRAYREPWACGAGSGGICRSGWHQAGVGLPGLPEAPGPRTLKKQLVGAGW